MREYDLATEHTKNNVDDEVFGWMATTTVYYGGNSSRNE